jgi:hypothetical protein
MNIMSHLSIHLVEDLFICAHPLDVSNGEIHEESQRLRANISET